MADYIVSEVDRINGLVGSFLDFARPLQLHPSQGELGPVLQQVVREQSELAAARGVRVTVKESGSTSFDFDSALLRVALSNLVQNAIQASALDQEVRLEAESDAERVVIRVTDQGEGIAPQNLENIFNPFFTTKPKGVGLGLALVTKIISEHHGKIDVRSELGKGTQFEVILPRS
jgi:signal transduction histidine kinase